MLLIFLCRVKRLSVADDEVGVAGLRKERPRLITDGATVSLLPLDVSSYCPRGHEDDLTDKHPSRD